MVNAGCVYCPLPATGLERQKEDRDLTP
jgi:hypothetical protein